MVRGLAFIPKAVLKIQRSCTESYKVGFERQYSVNSFDFPIAIYFYFPRADQEDNDYYFPMDLYLVRKHARLIGKRA